MIDWTSFLVGFAVAANACGVFLLVTVVRMRNEEMAWRREQRQRIDELQAWSARNYDQARKDIGLPPRVVS